MKTVACGLYAPEPCKTRAVCRGAHATALASGPRANNTATSARGREPFDDERLRALVAQGSLGRMNHDEERAFFEPLDDIEHTDVITREAFAAELAALGPWWT